MKLPKTILMYPMTLASQAAHIVMRFQQNMAELVIKGDATLETLFPPKEEQPEWATFDEDLDDELGIDNGGDDPQEPATSGAVFDVNIEHALSKHAQLMALDSNETFER